MAKVSRQQNELNDMQPVQCRLPIWKLTLRIVGVVLIFLTTCLLVSTLTGSTSMNKVIFARQAVLYVFLFLFNSMMFVPAVFEVRAAQASANQIQLKTLFWQAKLDWRDIVEFRDSTPLKNTALLRTAHCIYLFHKRDLINYGQIEQIIKLKS